MKLKTQQSGFTLIELVMVIVVLGILAVTALPKFIDLRAESYQASITSIAGSLTTASAMNRAARLAGNTASTKQIKTTDDCTVASELLEGSALPAGYTITSKTIGADSTTCTLNGPNSTTASFTLHTAG